MKKFYLSCLLLQATFAFSQVVPNPYFEGWNSKTTDVPKNWEVFGKTAKVSGKTGGSALRLNNSKTDGKASYAFQSVFDTSSFFMKGSAFAFGNTPDSMTITYRAALGADTAYMQVSFTKSGELFPLTFDEYELTGTAGTWKTVTLPVSYISLTDSLKADSGWIYIQSADDIDGPYANGYIEIDNISFIFKNHTTAGQVPNENFENWDSYTLEQPDGWGTSALYLKNGGLNINQTSKTTDKHSGNYALKLNGFVVTDPGTLYTDTLPGFALTMRDVNNLGPDQVDINTPAFKVTQRYQSIRGFMKSDLYAADQAMIMVNFFNADTVVGSAILVDKANHSAWIEFAEDIAWDSAFKGTPDSATIQLLVCDSFVSGIGSLKSWVIFDDLKFDNYSSGTQKIRLNALRASVYPNPSTGQFQIKYVAETAETANLSIQNMQGQVVYRKTAEVQPGTALLPVNLGNVTAGFYTVTLQTGNGIFTEKILLTP